MDARNRFSRHKAGEGIKWRIYGGRALMAVFFWFGRAKGLLNAQCPRILFPELSQGLPEQPAFDCSEL